VNRKPSAPAQSASPVSSAPAGARGAGRGGAESKSHVHALAGGVVSHMQAQLTIGEETHCGFVWGTRSPSTGHAIVTVGIGEQHDTNITATSYDPPRLAQLLRELADLVDIKFAEIDDPERSKRWLTVETATHGDMPEVVS
jgi:hypothetical protein